MGKVIDLKGKRFGRLTVLAHSMSRASDCALHWRCRCDCGTEKDVRGANLRNGGAKSCGCLRREVGLRTITHGHTVGGKRSPTWRTWESMIDRCTKSNHKSYARYGGRGIKVCDHWLISFDNFLADMGERPSVTYTLDRWPDNNGHYEPVNCRWATPREQANNRTNNVRFDYRGRSLTITELARVTGVPFDTLYGRLCDSKRPWTVEQAVSVPRLSRWAADRLFAG